MAEVLPRQDLVVSITKLLSQSMPTVLQGYEAYDPATLQQEYPQAIVQLPQEIDVVRYKFSPLSKFSERVDFYFEADKANDLVNFLDNLKPKLTTLALQQYPCRYERGSYSASEPVIDETTSIKLWHTYIDINFEIFLGGI